MLVNITNINNGTAADATQINTRFATIASAINGGIETVNLADSAVTTAKLANANVTTGKLADGAATPDKRAGGFYAGSFLRTTNGAEVISGVTGFNFIPKFIKFYAVFNHSFAVSNLASSSNGWFDAVNSTTGVFATAVRADGGAGSVVGGTYCVRVIIVSGAGAGSEGGRAICSAVSSGTFTLTFTDVTAAGVNVMWEAYG